MFINLLMSMIENALAGETILLCVYIVDYFDMPTRVAAASMLGRSAQSVS